MMTWCMPLFRLLSLSLLISPLALAAPNIQDLKAAIRHGRELFYHAHFGGNLRAPLSAAEAFNSGSLTTDSTLGPRMTCDTCHLHGGTTQGRLPSGRIIPSLMNTAKTFPHLNQEHIRVTLTQEIQHCITAGLNGKPQSAQSIPVVDLKAYIESLTTAPKN